MKKKVALITGITGQDGSYLAEFLIEYSIGISLTKKHRQRHVFLFHENPCCFLILWTDTHLFWYQS